MQAENSRPASGRWATRDILTFVVFNLVDLADRHPASLSGGRSSA